MSLLRNYLLLETFILLIIHLKTFLYSYITLPGFLSPWPCLHNTITNNLSTLCRSILITVLWKRKSTQWWVRFILFNFQRSLLWFGVNQSYHDGTLFLIPSSTSTLWYGSMHMSSASRNTHSEWSYFVRHHRLSSYESSDLFCMIPFIYVLVNISGLWKHPFSKFTRKREFDYMTYLSYHFTSLCHICVLALSFLNSSTYCGAHYADRAGQHRWLVETDSVSSNGCSVQRASFNATCSSKGIGSEARGNYGFILMHLQHEGITNIDWSLIFPRNKQFIGLSFLLFCWQTNSSRFSVNSFCGSEKITATIWLLPTPFLIRPKEAAAFIFSFL